MKVLILASLLLFTACASKPTVIMRPYSYGGARQEIFRAGTPVNRPATCPPWERNWDGDGLCPDGSGDQEGNRVIDPYDQVSHTCSSTPIWGIDGEYLYTSVHCF